MLRHTKTVALAVLSILLGLSAVNPVTAKAEIEVTDTTLISATPTGERGNGPSQAVRITSDGRYTMFQSFATNLASPAPPAAQVYLYDTETSSLEVISRTATGEYADKEVYPYDISDDGRFVLLGTTASNFPNATGNFLLYMLDRQDSTLERIGGTTLFSTGAGPHAMNGDGGVIVYKGRTSSTAPNDVAFIYERNTGTTTQLPGGPTFRYDTSPTISEDGRYAAYQLTAGGSQGCGDWACNERKTYLYDVASAQNVEILNNFEVLDTPYLHTNGDKALFTARQTHPDASDTRDVYLMDFTTGESDFINTYKISATGFSLSTEGHLVAHGGVNNGWADSPGKITNLITGEVLIVDPMIGKNYSMALSADGAKAAYTSIAPNGVLAEQQVYVAQLGEADTTAPTISGTNFNPNPKAVNAQHVELSAEVADDLSGVASVEYYNPVQETWSPMAVNGSGATATINTPAEQYPAGTYEFVVRATDEAGNETTSPAHLYIYNPASNALGLGSITPGGPTSDPGDNLPALPGTPTGQFTFTVTYGAGVSSTPTGTSTFTYGTTCILPWSNCFRMTTNSFDWLIVNGDTATFQGTASLTLGSQNLGSDFVVRVTATNGTIGAAGHYLLQLYEQGADPETATPLYQASGDVTGLVLVL